MPPDISFHTMSDRQFSLRSDGWLDMHINDIAWGLSQINRFYGQACRPYSVAEHSLLVMHIAKHHLKLDAHGQLAALMHDAHEAYCNDLHPTTKKLLGSAWTDLEEHYQTQVRVAFGLVVAAHVHAEAVHIADQMALAIELRDLKGGRVADWGRQQGLPELEINLNHSRHADEGWKEWRDEFLRAFHGLSQTRNLILQEAQA